jgi:hypothetical protein
VIGQAPALQRRPRKFNENNAVASLPKGGKVVRKGILATKGNCDKTALWLTRKIYQRLQVLHDGKFAKRTGNFAEDGDFAQEGKFAEKGNVAAVGKFAKERDVLKRQMTTQRITMHFNWCCD